MPASVAPSISAASRSSRSSKSRWRVTLAGPQLGRDKAILVGRRVVPCPFDGHPLGVSVNRRVDVLADERSKNRITEAQFLVGRMIQAVFERGSGARLGSAGWDVGGSKDQTIAHELAILYGIDDAEKVRAFTARMERTIGGVGVRFLRLILAEGQTFAAYAERTGKGSGERASSDIAKRFRWLLEALTEEQHTATGADGQRIRAVRAKT